MSELASVLASFRHDVRSVHQLRDALCMPFAVDDAQLHALQTALFAAKRANKRTADSEREFETLCAELQQLAGSSAELDERSSALLLDALRDPGVLTKSSEWKERLHAVWRTQKSEAVYADVRCRDAASLAAMQLPALIDDAGDALFGIGSVVTANRWCESETRGAVASVSPSVDETAAMRVRAQVTLCHFHLQGHCKKGEACEFAHVGLALPTVCSFFRAGNCDKADCAFSHDLSLHPCSCRAAPGDCPYSHNATVADFHEATQKRRALALQLQQPQQLAFVEMPTRQ